MSEKTALLLDALAALHEQRQMLQDAQRSLTETAMPAEVKQRLEDIAMEFKPKTDLIDAEEAGLEFTIKQNVAEEQQTAKGKTLMAVFTLGRITWDTKALEGYAAAHPELKNFRKVGKPSVSIRPIA
jgi:phage host-nuclease inhibitor protein Gam